MTKELIEELRNTFEYHPDGYLIRKSTRRPCGQRANHSGGYARVNVGKRTLFAHRIIYAVVTGKMPEGDIDHINGDRIDNRIQNLRDVSQLENGHNRKKQKNNSSGFQGVYWDAHAQKWRARICVNKQAIHLGLFEDINDAVQARKMAKIKYHPTSPDAVKFANESL